MQLKINISRPNIIFSFVSRNSHREKCNIICFRNNSIYQYRLLNLLVVCYFIFLESHNSYLVVLGCFGKNESKYQLPLIQIILFLIKQFTKCNFIGNNCGFYSIMISFSMLFKILILIMSQNAFLKAVSNAKFHRQI